MKTILIGREVSAESFCSASYFLYITLFYPPDISAKWIFPSVFQVRKLRHRW